ncbi:MAG: hypothetical protein WBM58_13155 [Sedimenticolaceae bacterium]
MKEQEMKNPTRIVSRFAGTLGAMGLAVLSSGSFATGTANTFFEVTVRPGSSVICTSDPCTVYFETPAGSGTHNILQNGTVNAGVAVGGQRVSLGVYSNENLVFHVEDTDLPVAYLTVVGSP